MLWMVSIDHTWGGDDSIRTVIVDRFEFRAVLKICLFVEVAKWRYDFLPVESAVSALSPQMLAIITV